MCGRPEEPDHNLAELIQANRRTFRSVPEWTSTIFFRYAVRISLQVHTSEHSMARSSKTTATHRIPVRLPGRFHAIHLGQGALDSLGWRIAELQAGNAVFIITSRRIGRLYLAPVLKSLRGAGFSSIAVHRMPDGERYKNAEQWEKALTAMARFDDSAERKMLVLNLGGGVVGDLGGFAAASYHRGIPYVQVPTTLLGAVDCGVGGKTGINLGPFKNSVGAIWHPAMVFTDLSFLRTLSRRQLKSGLAEVIKYAVSMHPPLLSFLERKKDEILALDSGALLHISRLCYRLKADVVERDHRDTKGIRVVLNYGHTVGHAVESASHYALTHGESVSIGMVCANDIALRLGLLEAAAARRVEHVLTHYRLPVRIRHCRRDDILTSMRNDKKFVAGKNRFVLLDKLGRTVVREGIPLEVIREVVEARMVAARPNRGARRRRTSGKVS